MASYQMDFKRGADETFDLINKYKGTRAYKDAFAGLSYFNGDNITISQVRRWYWHENVDENTGLVNGGSFMINRWVANNKISYGFYHDMVTQKVDTLFKENPTITIFDGRYEMPQKFTKQFGYALRNAGLQAAAEGTSVIFLDCHNNLNTFPASECVIFYDDEDGKIKAVIHFTTVKTLVNNDILRWEVFTEDGVEIFTNAGGENHKIAEHPYKMTKLSTGFDEKLIPMKMGLPLVEFSNNVNRKPDLSNNIRSKIDIIDLVQSGFANNIEDFSDVYMVFKERVSGDEAYYQDFMANIARSKKIIGEGVDIKQFQIPTEARSKFVEIMKDELIQDGGVVDAKSLLQGNMTATAIEAARANLETRVSAFEWEADKTANGIIELYKKANGLDFEYTIDFNTYKLRNLTETVQNAMLLKDSIPQEDFMKMLVSVGIISDVDKAIEKMQAERLRDYGAGGGLIE